MSQHDHSGPLFTYAGDIGRTVVPFLGQAFHPTSGADDAADVLRLRLQAQVLVSRALEVENSTFRREVARLQAQVRARGPPPVGDRFGGAVGARRPLTERLGPQLSPRHRGVTDGRGGAVATGHVTPSVPLAVVVDPAGFHSRFLPLAAGFQPGGAGSPMFSRPQDWPEEIRKNPMARPCGVRRWNDQPVCLDDLYVYLFLGEMVYGGNRPPGRIDPVDPQRPWRKIEAAFYRSAVAIILQPHLFTEIYDQLTPDQRARCQQPFLAAVEDPYKLDTRDVVQHLAQSGVTIYWIQFDMVISYAHSFLREWTRRHPELVPTTDLGRLYLDLYPNGIAHQADNRFIEDAAEEMWEDAPVGEPMDEEDEEDDLPPLQTPTPSPPQGPSRAMTPIEERVDYGPDSD